MPAPDAPSPDPASPVPPRPTAADRALTASVGHAENFPVASWLCPPHLRPAIVAIYRFARTADDLADEGDADADTRLTDLAAYAADLEACLRGDAVSGRWPTVFEPLAAVARDFALPAQPLRDLLSAFAQDVRMTRDRALHPDRESLLDYCSRSANPVGRLLLHLYGIDDEASLAESDAICSALQLINFWQDLSVDLPRGRVYLPRADLLHHGMDPERPDTWSTHPGAPKLIASLQGWTRTRMEKGLKLPSRVPGRAGWELRLVVQGGLRVLQRSQRLGPALWHTRPTLSAVDLGRIGWRALWM